MIVSGDEDNRLHALRTLISDDSQAGSAATKGGMKSSDTDEVQRLSPRPTVLIPQGIRDANDGSVARFR